MLDREQMTEVTALVQGTRSLIERELEKAEVTVKGAADYVTNVDFAVQDYLKTELGKRFPQISVIAEEKDGQEQKKSSRYWILDPIDGTTNLIHHYQLSAVSLALYEEGTVTFGVVYNPFTEETFWAGVGCGAYLNDMPISVSSDVSLPDALVSFGSNPYDKRQAHRLFALFEKIFLETADFRRTGSAALDICYVACGRQDAFLEWNLKPWDYAAAAVILKEAGGVITDWNHKEPVWIKNSSILAAAPGVYEELQKMIETE